MKRSLLAATVAVALLSAPAVQAAPYDPEDSDNPIRLVAYPVHFIGKVAEYAITRPAHWITSQPALRHWFGRTANPRSEDYAGSRNFEQFSR